jgi:hypothetical protein
MTVIPDFKPFIGQHCETMATGNLLRHAGLSISEPMLFGIGEGLGFGIFSIKSMPAPFIGGRVRIEDVTKNAAANLGFEVEFRQTRSRKKAWDNIACFVDSGIPVAAKLDCHFLDYFRSDFHFAAHYVAVYGYDNNRIHLVDTAQQGSALTTSRSQFEEGRLWKGPMASNALTWTVKVPVSKIDWQAVVRKAICSNAASYLNPPIKNFGASGIRKAANLAPTWTDTIEDAPAQLAQMGMLIERAGTGGGLFRRMYSDFLDEANSHLNSASVDKARELIRKSGEGWTAVSNLLDRFEATKTGLDDVADILLENANLEERAFQLLVGI